MPAGRIRGINGYGRGQDSKLPCRCYGGLGVNFTLQEVFVGDQDSLDVDLYIGLKDGFLQVNLCLLIRCTDWRGFIQRCNAPIT
jgi:hypothetical protein